jgi:hypothetical protein
MRGQFLLLLGVLLFALATGCTAGGSYTIVEKHVEPRHFNFVDVVGKRGKGPGGWRAACLHLRLQHTAGPFYLCRLGVEMPKHTTNEGPLSVPLSQRIAADCANLAADMALGATTPATPLGLACESFKKTFDATLSRSVKGSKVMTICAENTSPTLAP